MTAERSSLDYDTAFVKMSSAEIHIDDAKAVMTIRTRPAISSAYNAMLQASTALMELDGMMTTTKEHHKETVFYIRNNYHTKIGSYLVDVFDNGRRTRNSIQYRNAKEVIPFKQACDFVINAERFVSSIKEIIIKRSKNRSIPTPF